MEPWQFFKALSKEVRYKALVFIRDHPRCDFKEIMDYLNLPLPLSAQTWKEPAKYASNKVAYHLNVLIVAGLIERPTSRTYAITETGIKVLELFSEGR